MKSKICLIIFNSSSVSFFKLRILIVHKNLLSKLLAFKKWIYYKLSSYLKSTLANYFCTKSNKFNDKKLIFIGNFLLLAHILSIFRDANRTSVRNDQIYENSSCYNQRARQTSVCKKNQKHMQTKMTDTKFSIKPAS